jgi:hypothetical protein
VPACWPCWEPRCWPWFDAGGHGTEPGEKTPCWPRRDLARTGAGPLAFRSQRSPVRRSAPVGQHHGAGDADRILFASASAALLASAEFTPRILFGGSLIVLAALLSAGASAFFRALIGRWLCQRRSADRFTMAAPLRSSFSRRFSMTIPRLRLHRPQIDGTRCPEPVQRRVTGRQHRQCVRLHPFGGLEATAQKAMQVRGWRCWGSPQPVRDPGTDGEIAGFCQKNYGVSFR